MTASTARVMGDRVAGQGGARYSLLGIPDDRRAAVTDA